MLEKGRAPTGRADRPRPADRPRWWAVLAVALALMALVASLSATRGAPRHAGAPTAAHHSPPRAHRHDTTGATTTTGAAGAASGPLPNLVAGDETLPTSSATRSTTAPSAPNGASTATGQSTSTATTTASAGPATSTGGSTTTSAGSAPGNHASVTDPGYLSYPGNVSATYQVTAAGPLSASATWTGSAQLSLAISCPGRHDQQSGPSGLMVSVGAGSVVGGPGGAGASTCTVTIAEPSGTQATVSYSITVDSTRD